MRILARAVELLSVGGRIVYSTCTMNPIENEAVVATMLHKAEGELPSITTWQSHEMPQGWGDGTV